MIWLSLMVVLYECEMKILNTMFKQESNVAFNNVLFSADKINVMHETMKRLYLAAKELADTEGQSPVARLLNASPQMLKNWEARGISKQGMLDAEAAIGVSAHWLRTHEGDMRAPRMLPTHNIEEGIPASQFEIPHLAAKGSMGLGELMEESEEVIERITLKADWLNSNLPGCRIHDLAVISGRGNSMSPTFNDGDLLLVDCGVRQIDIDGVYVLSAHGRLFIKTVRQRIDGSFEISSDNPSVKTVDILNGDHQVAIHGRVVWAWNGKRM